MQKLDSIVPILLFLCTEQIWATPQPNPFISGFLQTPSIWPRRPRPHYYHPDLGHNHSPILNPRGRVISSSYSKASSKIPDVEYSDRPPAEFSHISQTEVNRPESYSQYDTSKHRHHRRDPHQLHGESSQEEDHENHDPDETPAKKGLKLFLLTPYDVTDQFQIVLIKRPKNNGYFQGQGHTPVHKPIYESSRHHPRVQHGFPPERGHKNLGINHGPPRYNYFHQLKHGESPKYGYEMDHQEKENSKSQLSFDSTNHGYAPSMLHKNYEVNPTPHNSTEISPSIYAPTMTYGYYGLGVDGHHHNATMFNIPKK